MSCPLLHLPLCCVGDFLHKMFNANEGEEWRLWEAVDNRLGIQLGQPCPDLEDGRVGLEWRGGKHRVRGL